MPYLILAKTTGLGTAESWILETGTSGGSDNAGGNGFGVDGSGNVYYTGFIVGATRIMTFGKVTPQGSLEWVRGLSSGAGDNNGQCSALDSSGNFYVCGSTYIDPPTDSLIAKYNSSGVFQWNRKFGDDAAGQAGSQFLNQIAIDSNNDIICGGNAYEGAQVAGRGQDAIMVKYNSSGTVQWQYGHASSGTDAERIRGMTTDSSNNIYFVGESGKSATVVKLNSSGVIQWQRRIYHPTDTEPDTAYGVAVDGSGNVYVGGSTRNGAVYGGLSDGFLAKYNSSGVLQWQRIFGDSQYNNVGDLALDSSGNLYTMGSTVVGGSTSAFICKHDSSGLLQWTRTLTHQNKAFSPGSIKLHESSGYMYILGSQNTLTSGSSYNHLIARLPMDGSDTGTYSGIAGSQMFYASATYSEQAGTLTDAAGILTTSSATSYPSETPTLTDADVSSSFDVSNLAELP